MAPELRASESVVRIREENKLDDAWAGNGQSSTGRQHHGEAWRKCECSSRRSHGGELYQACVTTGYPTILSFRNLCKRVTRRLCRRRGGVVRQHYITRPVSPNAHLRGLEMLKMLLRAMKCLARSS